MWTQASAGEYLADIEPVLHRWGFRLEWIGGSVRSGGHSKHDLDLLITPLDEEDGELFWAEGSRLVDLLVDWEGDGIWRL